MIGPTREVAKIWPGGAIVWAKVVGWHPSIQRLPTANSETSLGATTSQHPLPSGVAVIPTIGTD
ncbi:MAG: hypothetical protein M0Z39_00635 [Actinomycetota bacterium]|nr:hypothetical protein [Actinomycetota bacterium]